MTAWPTPAMLARLEDPATLAAIQHRSNYPEPDTLDGYDAWGNYRVSTGRRQTTVQNRDLHADRASIGAQIVDWNRCAHIDPDGTVCGRPRTGLVRGPLGNWSDHPACHQHGGRQLHDHGSWEWRPVQGQ